MTDTLFDLPDSHSPRLEWMRRHGVNLRFDAATDGYEALAPMSWVGLGKTELEALTDFAIKNNLKLWNEE